MKDSLPLTLQYIVLSALLVSMGSAGFLGYLYYTANQHIAGLDKELALTKKELASTTKRLRDTETLLGDTKAERDNLKLTLDNETTKINVLAGDVKDITGTVGTLQKLQATDKELLQKYSKVYFLNEHYIPPKLTKIDEKYTFDSKKEYFIHTNVWPFLHVLLEDAAGAGIDLTIISAYRSFGTQAELKYSYKIVYGTGANQFSADQGYSEHQLGTTVDFTTPVLGASFSTFDKTKSYQWLGENAYKYGFILSYPKNNAYYKFEPWHWRFAGKALASKLYRESKHFYGLDQREIDTFLVSFFD